MHRHTLRLVLVSLSLLIAACRDSKVNAYRVPKEKDVVLPVTAVADATSPSPTPASAPAAVPAAPGGGMAGTPVAVAAGPGLTWTAPAQWQPKALGAMRKGSFIIVGEAGATADLSITAFPGAVGGEFANVNRWRSQVALPPLAETDLASAVTHLTSNGLAFTVVDFASTDAANPQRILGAMAPYDGAMWFFKLTGPDALVTKEKPAFLEFLKTVKAAAPAAP
jgi:hypothetical protein